jgi:hypothetical protein
MGNGEYDGGNTVIGEKALFNVKSSNDYSGVNNTAIGKEALASLNVGVNESTGIGAGALRENNSGENTAVGAFSSENTAGTGNTTVGNWTGRFIVNGNDNTVIGHKALSGTATEVAPSLPYGNANGNTAVGKDSIRAIHNGNYNTAVGYNAGKDIVNEEYNTVIGANAKVDLSVNEATSIGKNAFAKANRSTAIGVDSICQKIDGLTLGNDDTSVGIRTTDAQAILDVVNNEGITKTLYVQGGFSHFHSGHINKAVVVSSNYIVSPDDYVIVGDTAGGVLTITLPNASTSLGDHTFIVKRIGANNLTVTTPLATAVFKDTALATASVTLSSDGASWTFIHHYDGVNAYWYVISK